MHEHIEEAIIKEVFEKPTIVESIEKTVVINEGETDAQKILEKRFTTITEKSADLELKSLDLESKGLDLESKPTDVTELEGEESRKSFDDLKSGDALANDLKSDDLAILNVWSAWFIE